MSGLVSKRTDLRALGYWRCRGACEGGLASWAFELLAMLGLFSAELLNAAYELVIEIIPIETPDGESDDSLDFSSFGYYAEALL